VEVYSNCQEVELLLNGKSLWIKSKPADDSARSWKVPYAPGILKAIGRNGRKIAATQELRTAGAPAKILLSADRNQLTPAWDDVCTVNVSVVDQNGVLIPNAGDLIQFKIEGPGFVAAVDNGDNASHEPFQAMERCAYQGRCIAMIKAKAEHGRITLTASAPGLRTASLSIQAAAEKRTNF
jgi:beta-galactosidase